MPLVRMLSYALLCDVSLQEVKMNEPRRKFRFSIREVMLTMLALALTIGWYRSAQRAEGRYRQLLNRQMNADFLARAEQSRAKVREELRVKNKPEGQSGNLRIENANLQGIVLNAAGDPLHKAWFVNCNLDNAVLSGGFQIAHFDLSNLRRGRLSGSFQVASFSGADLSGAILNGNFQGATFVDANLSHATLNGGGVSFQGASLERATLAGAQLIGGRADFGGMNIDGADFRATDLSNMHAQALESCSFEAPPLYDNQTKFPSGFSPVDFGWKQVESQNALLDE